jgi:hypothetical protein
MSKILCLGRQGNVRSVTLAYLLKNKGHDAIAVGMRRMGKGTRMMMLDWAEIIILLHQKCQEGVPSKYWPKLRIWPVGREKAYMRDYHQGLVELFEALIKRDKL